MLNDKSDLLKDKVPIEEAINRAGFGLYSYLLMSLTGLIIIAFAFIGYGNPILVPSSACELQTTATQQGLLAAAPVVVGAGLAGSKQPSQSRLRHKAALDHVYGSMFHLFLTHLRMLQINTHKITIGLHLGSILGTVIWGYLADTKGRRSMLLVALLGGATFNSIASLSVNWIMMMILQFIASLFTSGLHSMSMSILSESVPLAKRNLVVLLVTSIYLLSQGIMAVMAIPIIPLTFSIHMPALGIYWNSWRTLMLVYSVPALIAAVWVYFMKESPKFVFSKGEEERTLEILKSIHKVNHLRSYETLEVTGIVQENSDASSQSTDKKQLSVMFKMPLLKYTLIMSILLLFQQSGAFLVWLPTIADQFVRIIESGEGTDQTLCGVIQASVDAPADQPCALNVTALLIVLAVSAMQSIVNLLLSVIVNRAGRRNLVLVVTSVCGIAGILVNLMPNAGSSVAFFAIQLMGIVVLGMYTAIIVALFPTHLRAIALAVPFTVGRMGTFASIQILNIMLINSCEAGFYVFASIYASSAIVASFLPDDRRLKTAVKEDSTEESASNEDIANNLQTHTLR